MRRYCPSLLRGRGYFSADDLPLHPLRYPPRPAPPAVVALRRVAPVVAALLVVTGAGCASTSEGGPVAYRAELGRAPTAQTLAGVSGEVLRLYGYDVQAFEADLVQTDWRYLPDGYRDRVTVRVRPRGSDLFNGSVRIVVEGRGPGGSWQTTAPTPGLRDQYAAFQKDVRTRLQRFMTQN